MLEKDLDADLDVTIGSDLAAGLKNVWVNPVNPASYSVMESWPIPNVKNGSFINGSIEIPL